MLELYLILHTCLVPADSGVLEGVAERRIVWDSTFQDWPEYDVLIASPDCHLLGKSGWFIGERGILTVKVTDCAQPKHRAGMVGWVDANVGERKRGWLVLR